MKDRRLGVAAFAVGAVGMILQYGSMVVRMRLTPESLPAWAVFGSVGGSVVVYSTVVGIAVSLLTLLVAVGLGYYGGRQWDIAVEYRRFVRTVTTGTVVGVGFVSLIELRPVLSSVGTHGSYLLGDQATELLAMDLLLPGLRLVQNVVEVGLIVVIGAFAGAALSQFRTGERSPREPAPAGSGSPSTLDPDPKGDSEGHARSTP